jgi:hypothetical protein
MHGLVSLQTKLQSNILLIANIDEHNANEEDPVTSGRDTFMLVPTIQFI